MASHLRNLSPTTTNRHGLPKTTVAAVATYAPVGYPFEDISTITHCSQRLKPTVSTGLASNALRLTRMALCVGPARNKPRPRSIDFAPQASRFVPAGDDEVA